MPPPSLSPETIQALQRRLQEIAVELGKLEPLIGSAANDLDVQKNRHANLHAQKASLLRQQQQITVDLNRGGAT